MRCRLCLVESTSAVNLFCESGEESNINKLIAKYIQLQISEDDIFSTVVCESCLQHLNDFHNFIALVEQRQNKLRSGLVEFHSTSKSNEEALLDMEILVIEREEHTDTFMKEEFGYASDTQVNKFEDENDILTNSSNNCDTTENIDEEEVPLKILMNQSTRLKQSKRWTQRDTKFKKPLSKRVRPRKTNASEEIKPKLTRPNVLTAEAKEQGEQIFNCIRLKCEICNAPAETLKMLRCHFREVHNSKAFVICCGRRFIRRFVLLDHLRYHLNPEHFNPHCKNNEGSQMNLVKTNITAVKSKQENEFWRRWELFAFKAVWLLNKNHSSTSLRCEICDKVLKSKSCLEKHHANMHSDFQNRKHECDICKKRFAHSSNLNSHMITHANERDHICEICNKGFKSSNMLKNHVTYVHQNKKQFICEICGQKYKFQTAFKRHVADHSAEPNLLTEECPICKKWFRPNGLRFHIGRHKLENVECETCGKVVKSKLALKSHVKYWHTRKEILKCNYCDKTFKRTSVLKEHIAMHTGQKDYSCQYCPREFRSKANMYAHIKKIHIEEWKLAQTARTRGPILSAAPV